MQLDRLTNRLQEALVSAQRRAICRAKAQRYVLDGERGAIEAGFVGVDRGPILKSIINPNSYPGRGVSPLQLRS